MKVDFDIEKPKVLQVYLCDRGIIKPNDACLISCLNGGVSNRTIKLEIAGGSSMVIKQALPKLRVAADWFCDPSRIHREALGLKLLSQVLPAGSIPEFIFEDKDLFLLGMECIPKPCENWKSLLLAGQIDMDHARQFGILLEPILPYQIYSIVPFFMN